MAGSRTASDEMKEIFVGERGDLDRPGDCGGGGAGRLTGGERGEESLPELLEATDETRELFDGATRKNGGGGGVLLRGRLEELRAPSPDSLEASDEARELFGRATRENSGGGGGVLLRGRLEELRAPSPDSLATPDTLATQVISMMQGK